MFFCLVACFITRIFFIKILVKIFEQRKKLNILGTIISSKHYSRIKKGIIGND